VRRQPSQLLLGRRGVEASYDRAGQRRQPVLVQPAAPLGGTLLCARATAAQQAQINYLYDELGRLVAVIDQQGDVAVYSYDAVGNLLSIQRVNASDAPGAVAISLVSPNKGPVGTTVTLFGKGFSATPSQNSVAFNGTAAAVTEAAPNRLVTSVPSGATTGAITLTAPLGNATSPSAFTVTGVTGPLTVTPTAALVLPSRTQQFTAALDGTATTDVTWAVNGIPGGDPAVGTLSTSGLYTAPATQALVTGATITATHTEDPTLTASATVTVIVPRPVAVAASVALAAPPATVAQNLTAAGSVQNGPAVTGVSPASATRGTSGLTVTLTGAGFTGATAVAFRLASGTDSSITVSNLNVVSDTELTITVAVASGAATGLRVVRVTTTAGSSTVAGTGGNLFTVQ
jgi:YD repeat-containing protein